MLYRLQCLFIILVCPLWSNAQTADKDSLLYLDIAPVTISVARLESSGQNLPFAVSILQKNWIQLAQAQRSLGEALVAMPGVYAWNTDNYAQDLRISIRGFGARSAFGIRGIRVFTDGIPETSPDGQTDLDNVDMGTIQRIELLRGAAAGLYGNAAGGILQLTTENTDQRYAEIQTSVGSLGFYRWQFKSAFHQKKLSVFFNVSQNHLEGYRTQSSMQQTIANAKWQYRFSPDTKMTLLLNYGKSPYANDPGGLTAEQVLADRKQARAASLQFNTGEQVAQGRIGWVLEHRIAARHSIKTTAFFTTRDFSSRLPFKNGGWVALQRNFGGGNAVYAFTAPKYRSQLGIDMGTQRDLRRRFNNDNGEKTEQTFDQTERFAGIGAFWINEWKPLSQLLLTAATRMDAVQLRVKDRFLSDEDQSGQRSFQRLSPTLGVLFKATPQLAFYANVATNFETPTLNELSANPQQTGGFNSDLSPQKSVNYELGIKFLQGEKWQIDLAIFQVDLRNELVPYQLATTPGRTYFRNAGRSQRRGIEAFLQYKPIKNLTFLSNYTFSNFKYTNYEASGTRLDGNRQPAIPLHRVFAALQWERAAGLFCVAQIQAQSHSFVNDANTIKDKGYTLVSVRGGYTFRLKRFEIAPFAGWNNIFNAAYSNNILVNAVGDRYFEPAAGSGVIGGVRVRF